MLSHLLELRHRLIRILIYFLIAFILFFSLAPHLLHSVLTPLLKQLSSQQTLIATNLTTPLFIPIKLAFDAAFLCTMPFILLHFWQFISPALYPNERQGFRWLIISSLILFALGSLFCFYVILPFMFKLITHSTPTDVNFMPDISYSVNFIVHMIIIFGLCFQLPLINVILVQFNIVSLNSLKIGRSYFVVGAFIVGMLLTPPDVFSQITLAIPLCLLYEVGIFAARFCLSTRVPS